MSEFEEFLIDPISPKLFRKFDVIIHSRISIRDSNYPCIFLPFKERSIEDIDFMNLWQ